MTALRLRAWTRYMAGRCEHVEPDGQCVEPADAAEVDGRLRCTQHAEAREG